MPSRQTVYRRKVELTHRAVAIESYNAAWSLLEQQRDEAQDRDLLGLALTSRYHWAQAGGPREQVIADWMVSRCCAALGEGRLALSFAQAALAAAGDVPAWLRASLHEGLARAAAAIGDGTLREEQLTAARAALAAEPDDEEREIIQAQIDDVPPV